MLLQGEAQPSVKPCQPGKPKAGSFRFSFRVSPSPTLPAAGRCQAPGGRWLQNGWLEVKEMLPLMVPALRKAVSATTPFVYMDVGCKDAEEAVFVLHTFPEGAQVRPRPARVCNANTTQLALPRSPLSLSRSLPPSLSL
jgi:hypothetical protein